MAVVGAFAVVHYFSDFITSRVTVETTLDDFKEEVCKQWKHFTPGCICFFYKENGKDISVDCNFVLQALTSLTHSKKNISFDLHLQTVPQAASSSSSSSSSVVTSDSIRNSEIVRNYLEDKRTPSKPLLSDSWSTVLGKTGHVFVGGIQQVRDAYTKYRLRSGFCMIVSHNEPSRFTAKCLDTHCEWKFHAAAIDESNQILVVRMYQPEHTCGVGGRDMNQKFSAKFLSSLIEDEVRKNPHKKPADIAKDFSTHYGINMEYYQAYNGREAVYKTIYGDDVMSYTHLLWYVDAVKKTNPGSLIDFQFDPISRKFERIFISFAASIQGYQFCRPLVYLDGTFLTGRFRGCLMAATGIDGDQGFFPLAMALVPGEDIDNWKWFLENLVNVVDHDRRPITFLTDRGEGLKQGVPTVFQGAYHSFCYYHLKTNLPINASDPRYSIVIDHFQEATYAYSPERHAQAIQKIRDIGCDWVTDYIRTIPVESYANAYFKGCRYGRTASSLAESFNSWIKVHKKMPASALLDQVRIKVMELMAKRREVGAKMKTPLTTDYEATLESLQNEGLSWQVNVASTTVFEVRSERTHSVDLEHRTCTCQRWRVYGFPCPHSLAAMRKGRRLSNDFIEPYFSSDCFRKTYMNVIQPIPNYNRPEFVEQEYRIICPDVRRTPGRPKAKRILSYAEKNKVKKRKVTCSNCKEQGHNRQGCTNPSLYIPPSI